MEATSIAERISSLLHTRHWYHALTLEERLTPSPHREPLNGIPISEQARKKLRRWKEQPPFEKGSFFADRLAMDHITEEDMLALLAEPVEALQQRVAHTSHPEWLSELAHTLASDASLAAIAQAFKEAERQPDAFILLQPFYPLLQRGVERFQAAITALSEHQRELPFDPATLLSLFLPHLARKMLPEVSRAVVLEMNIARLRGQLQGDTAQARFHDYVRRLSQREHLQAFLQEYCILARQLIGTINRWVDCSLECVRHLCRDWEHILETFTPERDPGLLTEVAGGAGDTHRKGHSVMILTFHSGWRLVYKPRSLGIDTHFQELLTWLNAHGHRPAFRTLALLDKKTYGWVEYISEAECASEHEIRRFYERQGSYLALFYALNGVDFHAENIIAAGEHPFFVDLEALFHPHMKAPGAQRPAQQALAHSVLGVTMLPQRIWSNEEFAGVDISGLSLTEGQLSSRPVPQWEGVGTDEMKLIQERVKLSGNKNSPAIRGQQVQALDFLESITAGFTSMYRLLMAHREEFVADVLPRFAHDEIRFIARPTRTYGLLLSESFHPNILRDALKRERFFDRLWIDVEHQPSLRRLIPAERADLFRGDIPLFTTSPASRDLFSSQGECLPAFFPEPAGELVRKRLGQLGEEDLQRQLWIIRAAFTSTSGERPPVSNAALLAYRPPTSMIVSRERFRAEAQAIGDRLCELAFQDESGADWIGLAWVKEREWSITPAGIDLYSGLPGIILFLSYLGATMGETRYTLYARAALKTLRGAVGQMNMLGENLNIGAFNGLGSCIYLFSHLATLWNDLSLLQEAGQLVELLPARIPGDDQFDLMDGSAGCILSLVSLYAVCPSASTLATAIQCGDHLLACAQPMSKGIGWKTARQQTPLPGLSHGAAGIALSLLKLASVSGETRFRQAAGEALLYERSHFSKEKRNGLDLRSAPQTGQEPYKGQKERTPDVGMSWSHGAPGIALARLTALGQMDDELTRSEIARALPTLLEEGIGYDHELVGPNHSLAHGDCGTLETLLMAAQVLDTPHLGTARERSIAQVLESKSQRGWMMGVPLNVETPGLMMGLAGIGYAFLRLSEPDHVPSILVLAPPVGAARFPFSTNDCYPM